VGVGSKEIETYGRFLGPNVRLLSPSKSDLVLRPKELPIPPGFWFSLSPEPSMVPVWCSILAGEGRPQV
jgi:hypothetical protein